MKAVQSETFKILQTPAGHLSIYAADGEKVYNLFTQASLAADRGSFKVLDVETAEDKDRLYGPQDGGVLKKK